MLQRLELISRSGVRIAEQNVRLLRDSAAGFHSPSPRLAGMPPGHSAAAGSTGGEHDPPGVVIGRGYAVPIAGRSGCRRGAVLSQACFVLALMALATVSTAWIAPAGPNGMLNMPCARQSAAACGGRLPLATSWGARSLPAMHLRRGRARTMLAGLSAQQQQRGEEEHDDDEDEWDDDGGWGQPEHVKARGTHRHAATTCIQLYAAGYDVVESLLQPCCSVRLCRGAASRRQTPRHFFSRNHREVSSASFSCRFSPPVIPSSHASLAVADDLLCVMCKCVSVSLCGWTRQPPCPKTQSWSPRWPESQRPSMSCASST